MNIRPHDLGPKWQIALLQRRSFLSNGVTSPTAAEQSVAPQIGVMGRWWTRGLGLSPVAAEAALAGFKQSGSGTMAIAVCAVMEVAALYFAENIGQGGHLTAGLATALVGTGFAGLWPTFPRIQMLGIVRRPITDEEITALADQTHDPLERSYLRLIQEIGRQTPAPDAVPGLRGAVRALGQALSQLPLSGPRVNGEALRQASAQRQAEAERETDAVIAASLERQAAALRRSADTAERSARLMRRTAALRDELSAQIESLQLGLTGFQSSSGEMSSLSDLAEAVQTVAVQAASLADARAELEAALEGRPEAAGPPAVPQMLRAGSS